MEKSFAAMLERKKWYFFNLLTLFYHVFISPRLLRNFQGFLSSRTSLKKFFLWYFSCEGSEFLVIFFYSIQVIKLIIFFRLEKKFYTGLC